MEDERDDGTLEKEPGIGVFLSNAREKKGLTQDQLAEIIRLRKGSIASLETEEWKNLPSPVFIKGFIRSYAKATGIDIKEAIRLYEKQVPQKDEIPVPLAGIPKARNRLPLFLFAILLISAIALYLWVTHGPVSLISNEAPSSIKPEEEVMEPEVPPSSEIPEDSGNNDESTINTGIEAEYEEQNNLKKISEEREGFLSPEEVTSVDNPAYMSPESHISEPKPDHEPGTAPQTGETPPFETPIVQGYSPGNVQPYVLTGIVNMRTYIKIFVDNNPPKEYIFKPGSRPQWAAEKGFQVVVGNAAGIEFEFNGKIINNLGNPGKVVSLSFPEGFKPEIDEE